MPKAYLEIDEVERLEKATTNLRDRLLVCLLDLPNKGDRINSL